MDFRYLRQEVKVRCMNEARKRLTYCILAVCDIYFVKVKNVLTSIRGIIYMYRHIRPEQVMRSSVELWHVGEDSPGMCIASCLASSSNALVHLTNFLTHQHQQNQVHAVSLLALKSP